MDSVDIREIVDEELQLVFAADQRPFTHDKGGGVVNHFCVLVPLMTLDGRRIEDLDDDFPDRGRVWWMLRQDLVSADIRPGSLWTGRVERAVKPDKDHFQAQRASVIAGARDWVEILDVDSDDPDIGMLCSAVGLACDRQPLKRVIIRGRKSAVGPLLATHRPTTDTLELKAFNASSPTTFRFPTEAIAATGGVQEFEFHAAQWHPSEPACDLHIAVFRERHLESLERQGEVIDAAQEAQIVKWALNLAGYTNAQRSSFRQALEALPASAGADEARFPGRLERFRRLCTDAERVHALGQETARIIADAEPLRSLVETHIQVVAEQRIEERVASAIEQLDRQTALARANLEKVQTELRGLEERHELQKQEQEELLRKAHAAQIEDLARRESELADREQSLTEKEQDLETRLEEVIADYRERAEEVTRRVLTYLPILRRVDAQSAASVGASREAMPALATPAMFERTVDPSGIEETGFLDQFRSVVERRGFVYHDEDLVNFHVALKVGLWTVVAGPTGLGKSSLPRLYAEALGMRDRYLKIAVQPDWLDDRDVIGAFNSLSGRFEPATTGLVQQLIFAEQDLQNARGGIYLICLDEMNLSRVEHYFARFLSLLEDPSDQRVLRVLGRGVGSEQDPFARHRTIRIGDNVRFVGTVNVDETTHFFSPKVLDRSSLMTLDTPDLARSVGATTRAQELTVQPVRHDTWSKWLRPGSAAPPADREVLLLLDGQLRRIQSGIGFRMRDRILAYVASAQGLLEGDRPFDHAIAQSVMPRLRTQHQQFREVADELLRLLPPEKYPKTGRILELLKEADGACDFFQLL